MLKGNIKSLKELDEKQMADAAALQEKCNDHDGTSYSVPFEPEEDIDENLKCFHLYYEDERLAGVVVAWTPDMTAAEIYALTDPEYRKKGIFTELLGFALKELSRCRIYRSRILFVVDYKSEDGLKTADALSLELRHVELLMLYKGKGVRVKPIGEISHSRAGDLVKIDEEKAESAEFKAAEAAEDFAFYTKEKEDIDGTEFLLCVGRFIIAGAALTRSENYCCISYFYVDESLRGNGYGKLFLRQLLHIIFAKNPKCAVGLVVAGENDRARSLYEKLGFETVSQRNYYLFRFDLPFLKTIKDMKP